MRRIDSSYLLVGKKSRGWTELDDFVDARDFFELSAEICARDMRVMNRRVS